MYRNIVLALIFTVGLLPAALILSSNANAQQQLDVCYYDSWGNQHDADWCKIGGDLSNPNTMNLSPHCRAEARATCFLGNSGQCRHSSKKYSQFVIFPKGSGRCPTTFNDAVARSGGGGGGQPVTPSCPSGYVFSAGQCIQSAGPAPNCPPGYIFQQGQCMPGGAPAPVPVPPVNLAYPLQTELKRIGCLRGAVDGIWGNGSRAALRNFLNRAGLSHLDSYSPSQAALDATYNKGPGFCPPVYVAPRPPVYQPPTYQPGPPTVPRQIRCSKVKYGYTRGNTCACSGGRIFTGTACVKPIQRPWQPGECRVIGGVEVCS